MKPKTRLAWGLSALLALALVGGLSAFASYRLRTGAFVVVWHPIAAWRDWPVGRMSLWLTTSGPGGKTERIADFYSLGFVHLEVPAHRR